MTLYPHYPGYRVQGPSADAAGAIAPRASRLRDRVLGAITAAGACGLTADEAADALGLSVLSARPRLSELRRLGLIRETGERRHNASGMTATVWRAVIDEGAS